MSVKISARLFAAALALAVSPLPLMTATTPATAQVSLTVSFDYFHAQLAPYGRWLHHARWGDIWVPAVAHFRPYYRRGHWVYTDAGWMWVSDYRWGNIAFHYGRWVYDPEYGWVWVPGYVWAPAWVIWREGDGYVGWFPMPPDNAYLAGEEIYTTAWTNYDRAYGYLDWYGPAYGTNWLAANWVFCPEAHFADSNYVTYALDPPRAEQIVGRTRDVTNYATVNDYVVNRSVDPAAIERASGHAFAPVPARNMLRANSPIDPVSTGRRIRAAEISKHGGDPRAPANAKAVPLNAAAAARGGRNAFANQKAAAAPNRAAERGARTNVAAAPHEARMAHGTARMERVPSHVAMRAEHGPAAAHGEQRVPRGGHGSTHVAAMHNERSAAPRMHEANAAPRMREAHAPHAGFAPQQHVAHFAVPHERGLAMAFHAPHVAAPRERGPAIAFGGPPQRMSGGGGPHGGGGGGGGPPTGFGGGGGPHGGGGGGGGPHGGGGGGHGKHG